MHRVFLPGRVPAGQEVALGPEDAHHIRRVLRLQPGDTLWLSDGDGHEAVGHLTRVEGGHVWVRPEGWRPAPSEPALQVVLAQAVSKADRMDWLIQKATELGVYEVVPLLSERVVVRLEEGAKAVARQRRWQRIAREAARQTQRGRVPNVAAPAPFHDVLRRVAEEQAEGGVKAVIPWEVQPELSLRRYLEREEAPARAWVFIGPEGGWAPGEVEAAQALGIEPVGMGPRVLRTETAGVVAVALVMAWWGDLR